MKMLDLFCGAGGAGMGYHRAGFEVIGVDIKPQPHYPFTFIQGDALEYCREHGHEYDAIHASPPCQRYSTCTPMAYRGNHPDLIAPMRDILIQSGKPYIIENVPNARKLLINPIKLCGSAFNLPIRRHRYFEIVPNQFILQTPCDHTREIIYVSGSTGSSKSTFHRFDYTVAERRGAMKTPWMTDTELDEAIPPAYTEFIGRELMKVLNEHRTSK
jgi:DNA (cytosine-5)-methyltransferase 1